MIGTVAGLATGGVIAEPAFASASGSVITPQRFLLRLQTASGSSYASNQYFSCGINGTFSQSADKTQSP